MPTHSQNACKRLHGGTTFGVCRCCGKAPPRNLTCNQSRQATTQGPEGARGSPAARGQEHVSGRGVYARCHRSCLLACLDIKSSCAFLASSCCRSSFSSFSSQARSRVFRSCLVLDRCRTSLSRSSSARRVSSSLWNRASCDFFS